VVTTGAIRRAKLQSNSHHQQTDIQLFTGWMPFQSSNRRCQHWKEIITFHGLNCYQYTRGLPAMSLTTINAFRYYIWWGRVGKSTIWHLSRSFDYIGGRVHGLFFFFGGGLVISPHCPDIRC